MKKVFIAGATGGIGSALVAELTAKQIEVIAFARTEATLKERFRGNALVTCIAGDVLNDQDVLKAAQGADTIMHAVSFPYEQWEAKHIPCLENLLKVAKQINSRFVMLDNIYAYGKAMSPVKEDVEKRPHTKKGKKRLEMERLIKNSGVPYVIAHIPDVFGPYAVNTVLYSTLQAVVQNKKAYFVGRMDKTREFAYTPDIAKAVVALALKEESYNQHWNIPGCLKITGDALQSFLHEQFNYRKKLKPATTRMIAFLGLFSPFMREQKEMMYLTETPVIVDGEKLQKMLGHLPLTDTRQSLTETIHWIETSKSL
ncbi:NAD-dependent epimerase/dehydratase family protein [Lysinibacillus sp. LZ02]|uniref:NAD-dependent epimerase/dehydratase family protein n=1 Tax=Lysinibacillus sp. LZ02 TaxID=3420668 RepID=UPI003D3634CA